MKPLMSFCSVLGFLALLAIAQATSTFGSQIRISKKGLEYVLQVGLERLKQEFLHKPIKDIDGSGNRVEWGVSGIKVHHFTMGSSSLLPVGGVGLRASVSGISLKLSGTVSYKYQKGWFKVRDSTSVQIKANGVTFDLTMRIGADQGRPTVKADACSSRVHGIDLDFSGGASWIYNIFAGIFEGKLKNLLQEQLCVEGRKLIDRNADRSLTSFPVTKKVDQWALINYEFEKPVATNDYFDLLLRGEFQHLFNRQPTSLQPPVMDLVTTHDRMIYIWLSDFTLNSAGQVYHDSGFLNRVITSSDKLIPDDISPFMNTESFKKVAPMLAMKYPNRPIQFRVGSYKPPTVSITPGKIQANLYATITIEVQTEDGSLIKAFFVQLDVSTTGKVMVSSDYKISGEITDFSFASKIGGSILGGFVLPVDNPAIRNMVKSLLVDQGNSMLQQGFPIPNIDGLRLVNPQVTLVQNAIRIDTDVQYLLNPSS